MIASLLLTVLSATQAQATTPLDLPVKSPVGDANFGAAVAGPGDIDGDGRNDAVVGAPYARTVVAFPGSRWGIDPMTWSETGEDVGLFGEVVAAAGDVNADGYPDLVSGTSSYGGNFLAFVLPGSSSGLSSETVVELEGPTGTSYFGAAVGGGGDYDDDGYDDVLIGAPNVRTEGGRGAV